MLCGRARLLGALLAGALACGGLSLKAVAQSAKADRDLFVQVKAQADAGDARAQLRLASFYASGFTVTPDLAKALKWHRKAAEQGLDEAQYQLGMDYAEGAGVKPDSVMAAHWFQKAAEQGLPTAELELGQCYAEGHGVRENAATAVKWFRLAAEHGMLGARYELGKCYFDGKGVPKDIEDAVDWTRQAAERGYAPAQYRLGTCYEKGEGVPKDGVQAYMWFSLAAAQDDDIAPEVHLSMAKVETTLTKEQITHAQKLAHEFKPLKDGQPASPAMASGSAPGSATNAAPSPAGSTTLGVVMVKADDDTSEVFVDGAFVGNPPARLKLAEGKHVVEVKKAGFKSYRREIQVGADAELSLHAVLEKQ
jgi:TPR repeat protein